MGFISLFRWRYTDGPIQHLSKKAVHVNRHNSLYAGPCRILKLHESHHRQNKPTSVHPASNTMSSIFIHEKKLPFTYRKPFRTMFNLLLFRIYNDSQIPGMRPQWTANSRCGRPIVPAQRFYDSFLVLLSLPFPQRKANNTFCKSRDVLCSNITVHIQSILYMIQIRFRRFQSIR